MAKFGEGMDRYRPKKRLKSHEVKNQVPELSDDHLWAADAVLRESVQRFGGQWATSRLEQAGHRLASREVREWGRLANQYPPVLKTFDQTGHRLDEVEFHPAYHHLMSLGMELETHSIAWTAPKGGHVVHTALEYMLAQVESGVCCPLTMTYAATPALRQSEALFSEFSERLVSHEYDARCLPLPMKRSMTVGMAMTEKQGGSDVRANQTVAVPTGGEEYVLTGHKWFCSAPMSDGFLSLAQAPGGLTCFWVPRWTPDGERNGIELQRLKDKMGNRSNASSEIEYHEAWALRLGDEGRGVATIIEMVHHTRLDCTLAAAGIMRQAVAQAVHHASYRRSFGRRLVDHPLMQNVLTDLALEVEAATVLSFRIAEAFDESATSEGSRVFARLAVALGKFWNNKRIVPVVGEAMECLGGAGYVEESMMPRLFREAPLNGIWEGSGNVICLDILRAMTREPESISLIFEEISKGVGHSSVFDAHVRQTKEQIGSVTEYTARRLAQDLALALQGSLMLRYSPNVCSELFCRTRLNGAPGRHLGTLPPTEHALEIIQRVAPLRD